MKRPTLCLIVPNYNHSQYLPKSLDSIMEQSWPADEVIVVDDGSTDNSVEVIENYRKKHPRIRLIKNEKNQGVLAILNRGMNEYTSADYIHFPAADDELLPGLLEKSMTLLAAHPQAGLSSSISDLYEPGTGLNWQLGVGTADHPCYLSPTDLVALEKRGKLFIASNTVVWKRAAIIEAGGFRGDLRWHADNFAVYVTAFKHGMVYTPEVLARFNVFPNSYYRRGRKDKTAHRAVLERFLALLTSPEFMEAGDRMCEGGSLYQFAAPILPVLWQNPAYRRFIHPTFLRKNLWYSLQVTLKPYTPPFIGNLYLKLAGYGAPKKLLPPKPAG